MSDDLVSRLRQDAEMLQDGPQSNLTKLWHSEVVKDAAKDCHEAATALTEARAEIERLRGGVYVPGQWRCAKCKFTLQQMNLNANTGTVTARDDAGDKCPNCNSPLWRVTWKQDAHEMVDRATEQMERAKAAESELATLRDMLTLCGELGGMQPGETMADYLRRLIDDVAGKEAERELAKAAAITAYLAQAGKEGWVMVPLNPTDAMIEAGCDNNPTQWNEGTDLGFAADVANDIYRAMLAAAQNGGK